jgi:hypothetical protein
MTENNPKDSAFARYAELLKLRQDFEELEKKRLELREDAQVLLDTGGKILLQDLEQLSDEERATQMARLQKLRRDIEQLSRPNEAK